MNVSLLCFFNTCLYRKLHLQDVKIQCIEDVDVEADRNESIHIDKVLEVKVDFVTAGLLSDCLHFLGGVE